MSILKKTSLGVIAGLLLLTSCSSSESTPSAESTPDSTEAVTVTTLATKTTLALEEFGTALFAESHIELVRKMMSVNVSNQVSDADIISAAQRVCYEMRKSGVDAWINKVNSYEDTDSTQDWRIRVASTLGAANFLCYEFEDEVNSHPIASNW